MLRAGVMQSWVGIHHLGDPVISAPPGISYPRHLPAGAVPSVTERSAAWACPSQTIAGEEQALQRDMETEIVQELQGLGLNKISSTSHGSNNIYCEKWLHRIFFFPFVSEMAADL